MHALFGLAGITPGLQLIRDYQAADLSYKDMATLALQLPKRKMAVEVLTREQALACELIRAMAKAAKKERSAEDVRFFEEQRAEAIARFNRDPDSAGRIYDDVIAALNCRVSSATTQKLLMERDGGGPSGDANNTDGANGSGGRGSGGRGDGKKGGG